MTFLAVSNFVSSDEQGLGRWLIEHYFDHLTLYQGCQALGFTIPDFPIQTMSEDKSVWLAAHQRMHQAIWTAIGGSNATDLSDLDWENDGQLYSWLDLHRAIHLSVHDTLGV